MTDSLAGFVRDELLDVEPRVFVQRSAWTFSFVLLGVFVGGRLTAEGLLAKFCSGPAVTIGSDCVSGYTFASQFTTAAAAGTAALLVVAMVLTYWGDG